MAQHQVGNLEPDGFVNKQRSTAGSVADSNGNLATPANYMSLAALDTRLNALGYSQADLDKMSANDKIYALRLNDDSGTV